MAEMKKVHVLFVCLGNICRSPLAEGVFLHLVEQKGLEQHFLIDSAGTSSWHEGEPPDERGTEAALLAGFDISTQRARKITTEDFERFHYILAMDQINVRHLRGRVPEQHQSKIDYLLNHSSSGILEVPDPYYGGVNGFQECLSLIRDGAEGLLETLLIKHFPSHR
jgi:protein-tyrosine phosphatase